MTVVLRKTFGKYSAGTRVRLIKVEGENVEVEAFYTQVEFYTDFNARRQQRRTRIAETFAIPSSCLEERRNMTDEVPATPREKLPDRVARRQLYKMLHSHEAVV